jgi:hypothetical protein
VQQHQHPSSVFLPRAGYSSRVPAHESQPVPGVRCSTKPGTSSYIAPGVRYSQMQKLVIAILHGTRLARSRSWHPACFIGDAEHQRSCNAVRSALCFGQRPTTAATRSRAPEQAASSCCLRRRLAADVNSWTRARRPLQRRRAHWPHWPSCWPLGSWKWAVTQTRRARTRDRASHLTYHISIYSQMPHKQGLKPKQVPLAFFLAPASRLWLLAPRCW